MAKKDLNQTLNLDEMEKVVDFKESSKKINEKIMVHGLGEVSFTEEITATPIGEQAFKGNIVLKKGMAKEPKGTEIITFEEIIEGEKIYSQTILTLPGGPVQMIMNFFEKRLDPSIMPNWLLITKYNSFKAKGNEIKLLSLIFCTKPPAMATTDIFNGAVSYLGRNFQRPHSNVFAAEGMVVHFLKIVGTVVAKMSKVTEGVGAPKSFTDVDEGKKFLDWAEVTV